MSAVIIFGQKSRIMCLPMGEHTSQMLLTSREKSLVHYFGLGTAIASGGHLTCLWLFFYEDEEWKNRPVAFLQNISIKLPFLSLVVRFSFLASDRAPSF
jgi:hypothetical protein